MLVFGLVVVIWAWFGLLTGSAITGTAQMREPYQLTGFLAVANTLALTLWGGSAIVAALTTWRPRTVLIVGALGLILWGIILVIAAAV